MRPKSYTYQHFDTAATPTPGAGSITDTTDGWLFASAYVEDTFDTANLVDSDIEVQLEIFSASAATPLGAFGIVIGDGAYAIALSIGSSLQVTDPTDVTTVLDFDWPSDSFAWQGRHVFRLRKVGSGRWTVHVDGALVATLPYLLALPDASDAFYRVGMLPGATSCTLTVVQFEVGVNVCVAPIEAVEQFKLNLPPGIRANWNAVMRGQAVAAIGCLRHGWLMEEEAPLLRGCDRVALDTTELTQARIDDGTWSTVGGLSATTVRNRLRMKRASGLSARAIYEWDAEPNEAIEIQIIGTFTLRGTPTLASGATGFGIYYDDTVKLVGAEVYRYGTDLYGWRFGYSTSTVGSPPFPIRPDVAYQVELRATKEHCLLLINGAVVDRITYGNFPATTGVLVPTASVGWRRNPGSSTSMDVENCHVRRYLSDQSARPFVRQTAAERTIFPSGGERADELRAWLDRSVETMKWRGTERGILAEARRLGASHHAFVSEESTAAGWLLDVTFPDITPIWLDMDGTLSDIYVEVLNQAPNWTADRLCELVAAYLVPVSTLSRRYFVCIATDLTATATAGSNVLLQVASSRGFEVGQSVSVVSYDRTSRSDATVTLVAPGQVTIDVLDATYVYTLGSEPFLRREVTDTIRMR